MISNATLPIKGLKRFLAKNSDVDFSKMNLLSIEENEDVLLRIKKSRIKDESLVKSLQAFQRILRLMDANNEKNADIALALIENNIHSAFQIAAFPLAQFIAKWQSIIPESLGTVADAQSLYNRAIIRKCQISVDYMKRLQNSEPHVLAAKL